MAEKRFLYPNGIKYKFNLNNQEIANPVTVSDILLCLFTLFVAAGGADVPLHRPYCPLHQPSFPALCSVLPWHLPTHHHQRSRQLQPLRALDTSSQKPLIQPKGICFIFTASLSRIRGCLPSELWLWRVRVCGNFGKARQARFYSHQRTKAKERRPSLKSSYTVAPGMTFYTSAWLSGCFQLSFGQARVKHHDETQLDEAVL